MKIVTVYRYLFYKIFNGISKIPFADETAEWSAMVIVSALVLLNILSIIIIPQIFTGKVYLPDFSRIEQTLFLLLILIPHYFLFIHKHKYIVIVNEFKNEASEKRIKGNRYTIIYTLFSFLIFFLLNFIKLIIWGKP